MKKLKKTKCTKSQASLRVYDRWRKSQSDVVTSLIDEKIHDFIGLAKANHSSVIAFTARQPSIAEITYNQIKKHNIILDQPEITFEKIYNNQIFPDTSISSIAKKEFHNSNAIFYKGILFAHDLNKKGVVFADFYKELSKYKNFKRVVFIDDGLHNLKSLEDATSKLGLEFYGYHIRGNFPFDPKISLEEETKYNKN
jgi:hypothetical protein